MATETILAGSSKGHLASMGAGTKAAAFAHPVGLAIAGGILIGVGAYYAVSKYRKNKAQKETDNTSAEATA